MTDKPTPTDAELKAMWQLHAADIGGIFDFARAVLAKWGAPQPSPGGPPAPRGGAVAWLNPWRADQVTTDYDAYGRRGIPLYTAPKPTTAQAASSAVLKAIREANMQLVRTGDDAFMLVPYKAAKAQAAESVPAVDEARRLFDAGWKAAALFCDREDVVADGVIGFGACPQFEAAFSAANGTKGGQHVE